MSKCEDKCRSDISNISLLYLELHSQFGTCLNLFLCLLRLLLYALFQVRQVLKLNTEVYQIHAELVLLKCEFILSEETVFRSLFDGVQNCFVSGIFVKLCKKFVLLLNFILLKIITHFELDAWSTFQKNWDRGKLGNLRNAQKTPV